MNRSETVERSRAVRILYGELQGKRADYVENRERRFAYAFLLLTCTIGVYSIIKIGVEPIIFCIIYTAIDMMFIKLRDKVVSLIKKK